MQYEKHIPMMVKILGLKNVQEGRGHIPFLKAIKTWDPKRGKFSTWLWHNLQLEKLQDVSIKTDALLQNKKLLEVDAELQASSIDPAKNVEFINEINHLSEDAKKIISLLFSSTKSTATKRTKFPISTTTTPCQIRIQIKKHFLSSGWTIQRYREAVKEIRSIL